MKIIIDIFKISSNRTKIFYFLFLIVALINVALEVIAISSILPLLDIIIGKSNFFFDKLNVVFKKINIEIDLDFYLIINFLIIIFFVKFIFNLLIIFLNQKIMFEMKKKMSGDLLNKYLAHNYFFFIETNSSKLIRNINYEVNNIVNSIVGTFLSLISELAMTFFILLFLLMVDFKSSLIIFIVLLIFGFIYLQFSKKRIEKLGYSRLESDQLSLKNTKEIFENIKILKIYNKEFFFIKHCMKFITKSAKTHFLYNFFSSTPRFFYEFILISVILIFLVYFGHDKNNIIYTITIFAAASFRLIPSISKLITAIQNIRFAKPSFYELNKDINILNKQKVLLDKSIEFNQNIKIEKLSYKYPKNKKNIFEDLNLEIKKNHFVGILGSSGSGKSTLLDLISGLITPINGNILVDDIPLNQEFIRNWQKKIGYMSQENILLDSSLIENIAFGENIETINKDKILNSIKKVNLDYLIKQLPDGLNSTIGERGTSLSGGEKQRLAIARTLYFENEILLLDEITSSLDNENEYSILNIISKMKDTTRIMITHNQKNLIFCDKVFILKDKKILTKSIEQTKY